MSVDVVAAPAMSAELEHIIRNLWSGASLEVDRQLEEDGEVSGDTTRKLATILWDGTEQHEGKQRAHNSSSMTGRTQQN